ncbi:MAG: hypothetical protein H7250_01800 [Flavobacterium sp.]|nr:hypothetical protein [Flavobacterium sp.]
MDGYKLEDLSLNNSRINLNLGNSGDIQILHVEFEGDTLIKRIVTD